MDAAALTALVPDIAERDVYLCGPEPFQDLVVNAATEAGVPASHLHTSPSPSDPEPDHETRTHRPLRHHRRPGGRARLQPAREGAGRGRDDRRGPVDIGGSLDAVGPTSAGYKTALQSALDKAGFQASTTSSGGAAR